MLDNDFIEIKGQLKKVNEMMEKSLKNYKREGFENKKVYHELEHYSEKIEDMIEFIKYMSRETVEDRLSLRADGRYEINSTTYFTSGSSIEVYIDGEWCLGRVESRHDSGKAIYYFLNNDGNNIDLYEGLRVRVRKRY